MRTFGTCPATEMPVWRLTSCSIFFPNDSCDTRNNDWFIGGPSTDLQRDGLKFEPTSLGCYSPGTCNAFGDDGLCLGPKSPTW